MVVNRTKKRVEEVAVDYIKRQAEGNRGAAQTAIMRFIIWYGRDRLVSSLTAQGVADYTSSIKKTEMTDAKKLVPLKKFFKQLQEEGILTENLGLHLRMKKSPSSKRANKNTLPRPKAIEMTKAGYEKLDKELKDLRKKRIEVTKEITHAAADKDFKENAPLAAAREQAGHIDGRINELTATFKLAVIAKESNGNVQRSICLGSVVTLEDMAYKEEVIYTIVSPKEVRVFEGKISNISPIGKALLGCCQGEEIEIVAPAGRLCYRVMKIG